MTNFAKKLETVANVVVIVVGALVLVVLVQIYILPRFFKERTPQPLTVGSSLSLENVDWKKNRETLILALSTSCHFCSESAPFYRRLVNESQGKQFTIVALLPESVEDGSRYLTNLNIPIRNVRQFAIKSIGVTGTPTLILVNDEGKIKGVWVGRLQSDKENEVLDRL